MNIQKLNVKLVLFNINNNIKLSLIDLLTKDTILTDSFEIQKNNPIEYCFEFEKLFNKQYFFVKEVEYLKA